jgi:hypothetical protein
MPAAAVPFVVMVSVEVAAAPFGVTVAELKLQAALVGRLEQERPVAALKPLIGVIVTVRVVELPPLTVPVVGATESEKSAVGAVIVTVIAAEVERAFNASPPYAAVME